MAKAAKRLKQVPAPPQASAPPRAASELRSLSARLQAKGGGVIEGHVGGVSESGLARAVLAGGEAIEALCPSHVDLRWLREACKRAPVAAAFVVAQPSGRHVLWGLFPGAAHQEVKADVVIRGKHLRLEAESVHLTSSNAQLRFDTEGNVALKGRDVTSHARRVNRIKGGSVRLN